MITFLLTFMGCILVVILLYFVSYFINLAVEKNFIDRIAAPFTILTFVSVILVIISVIILKII